MPERRLAARWVIPVEGRPIERGAVLIGADGRVIAVGPDAIVPRPAGAVADAYEHGLLLPGLINTHTHLELTGLPGEPPEPDFAAWILGVRRLKAGRSPEAFLAAARAGLSASHAAGVTTVADTGDSGAVIRALAESGGSGVAYHEVFGPHPDQLEESLAGLQRQVESLGAFAAGRVRIGVSPHAPYTVSGRLYAAVAAWARAERLPLATHVAESPAESELLARGEGAFAVAWRGRGIPLPTPLGHTPVEWLGDHGVLSEGTLCIHLVQATGEDVQRLARAGAAVAHCPVSNQRHGHGSAPLAALLGRQVRVGLGTDSVLSVGTPDLLSEARAARELACLDAARTLELCTLEGARALGLDGETGSLRAGKWGDCVVLRPRGGGANLSPEEQALASGPSDVLATYVGGRDVYRADRPV
ncbi:MAG: amidohydrolase family protein [Gemmatimonadales bacterium]